VSNSSTSGFRVPSSVIAKHFGVQQQDLLEGGKNNVFSQVLFGGSHQLSLLNILEMRADAGVFCNTCVAAYIEFTKGDFDNPQAGDEIRILQDAPAPFNSHAGEEVIIAYAVPVLNAPLVVNTRLLKTSEIEALKAHLTSDNILTDTRIFGNLKDPQNPAIFEKGERFVLVDDKWYNPIRLLSGTKLH
jgi:phosphonate transport system substrate-binding protein